MANVTLEAHQTRVDRAEEVFGEDLRRLARWSRHRAGKGKLLLLLGATAFVGALAVRSLYRRRRGVLVRLDQHPRGPSLIGTALRMAVLEAARLGASRLVLHFTGALERPEFPRLAPPAIPDSSVIDPKVD